jgi:hypothetical protein
MSDGRYPYQNIELGGATALLHRQILTGKPIAREILCEGRAGTGKTTGILTYLVHACYAWPGARILIVREVKASLAESVLETLESEVLGADHPAVINGPQRADRSGYQLGESAIVLGGLDRPEKLFSTRWDIIYMAEAIETDVNSWELFGRAQRPGGRHAAPFLQRIADVNPGPPGHWLNQRAFAVSADLREMLRHEKPTREAYRALQAYHAAQIANQPNMMRLISVHQDNPGYWDWNAWDWTPDGQEMLAGLLSMTGHRRERMLHGDWVAAAGGVYPEFSESVHTVQPFALPRDWPVYVFYDPGYDHPCAVLWIAVSPTGKLYIVDEIYGGGIGLQDLADQIKARNLAAGYNIHGYYGDPQKIDSSTQEASGVSIKDQMRKFGLSFDLWPRTGRDIDNQVEAVRGRLKDRSLFVFQGCRWTIFEFQSWRYKRTSGGEQLSGDDKFEDKNNNALDCTRGAVAQGLKYAPGKVELLSAVKPALKRLR